MLRNLVSHLGTQAASVGGDEEGQNWEYGGDVGEEVFEFGELDWCLRCAEHGCKLLTAAAERGELDLSEHSWGFSEEYMHCPERLAERFDGGRSVYWIMIHEGKASWGASVNDAGWETCLALPGFHPVLQWGLIAHASGMIYGPEGTPRRAADTAILSDALLIECRPPPTVLRTLKTLRGDWCCGPWVTDSHTGEFPGPVGAALGGGHGLEGLHNAGALVMKRSPEVASVFPTVRGFFFNFLDIQEKMSNYPLIFADLLLKNRKFGGINQLPMTAIGIPELHSMDAVQKEVSALKSEMIFD